MDEISRQMCNQIIADRIRSAEQATLALQFKQHRTWSLTGGSCALHDVRAAVPPRVADDRRTHPGHRRAAVMDSPPKGSSAHSERRVPMPRFGSTFSTGSRSSVAPG